jgi:kynurenine formamidase
MSVCGANIVLARGSSYIKNCTYIDLTQTFIHRLPVFPGDIHPELVQHKSFKLDGYTDFNLSTGMHAGTHIDGPMHLTSIKQYLSEIPLDRFIGKGFLLDVRNQSVIRWENEYENQIEENSIVLFYTGFSPIFGKEEYFTNYPVFDMDLAEKLIQKNIKMLGMDSPSPDKEPYSIHKLLLSNMILIAENLMNLDKLLGISGFEVIALPIKINADSAMTRVIARIC